MALNGDLKCCKNWKKSRSNTIYGLFDEKIPLKYLVYS